MFTTVGWAQSLDPNGVFLPVDAIPDQHVRTEADSIFIQEFNFLLGGLAYSGTVLGECRFVAPSLRRVNPQYIAPVESAITPAAVARHSVTPRGGVPLDPNEQLQYESNATLIGVQEISGFAWLADSRISPVEGAIRTVRFVIATTVNSVILQWVNAEIDFVDDLPIGTYDIVGAGLYGASIRAFRLVPIGAHHRPGAPGGPDLEHVAGSPFRFGELGIWTPFETVRPPSIDVSTSAIVALKDTEGFLDLIPR